MKHALLSPSSSHRWIPCPGSVALSKGEPNPPSTYSDEGTAAHHVASETLTRGVNAQAFVGMMVGLWGGAEGDESECHEAMFHPMQDGKNYEPNPPPRVRYQVTSEMAAHVQSYVDKVREYAFGNTLLVEQRLSTAGITGEEDGAGTSDAIILAGTELQVHDLKYGMGNRVDATDNSQLKIYALAALAEFDFMADFDRVRLVIHQPRLGHLSEWDCSAGELKAWGEDTVRESAGVALYLLAHPEELDSIAPFKAGEHCKTAFCPSRAKCPTLAAYVADAVGAQFEALAGEDAKKHMVDLVKLSDVDTDERLKGLGTKLSAVDVIEDWCKAVRARVESVLLESSNDPATTEALGFKLVQGRKGARAWKNAEEAEALLKAIKLKVDEMYERSLISPTTAEKVLKGSPKKWEKIIPIIEQKEGKPSVAPLGDKRPALVITPVADSFDDLEGGGLV